MQKLTIWHNPKCSKSRNALNLLEEKNADFKINEYLKSNPTKEDILNILQKLNINAKELLRTGEEEYSSLNLENTEDEDVLIDAMIKHPILIQRPIIINNSEAVIARPIENLELLLKNYM